MTDFTYSVDADGVATIAWDVPGKSMNVMSREGFALVSDMVDRALSDPAVRGIVVTSGKKDFAGGMDLNVLASITRRRRFSISPCRATTSCGNSNVPEWTRRR